MTKPGNLQRMGAVFLTCALACDHAPNEGANATAPPRDSGIERAFKNYPPGAWRAVPFSTLDTTVVWLSHIVIAHRKSNPADSKLRLPDWQPDSIRVDRSRDAAYKKAADIRRNLAREPGKFAEVAKRESDDEVTASFGGSLGGIHAGQLPDAVLDALYSMHEGDISAPIETEMGFHILLRRAPPPRSAVRWRRVVFGYRTTRFGPQDRGRAEALEEAATVIDLVRRGREFSSLASTKSHAPDAIVGGDMGTWSIRDPGIYGLILEELSSVAPGQIIAPIDHPDGVHVVQRLPQNTPVHEEYAMASIEVHYNAEAAGSHAELPESAERLARSLLETVTADRSQFRHFQKEHCCTEPKRWKYGHGSPELTRQLAKMNIGDISTQVIKTQFAYVIPMRLDPIWVGEPREPSTLLPRPAEANISGILKVNSAERLRPYVEQLTRRILSRMRLAELPPDDLAITEATLSEFEISLTSGASSSDRARALSHALAQLYHQTSPVSYSSFYRLLNEEVNLAIIMSQGVR